MQTLLLRRPNARPHGAKKAQGSFSYGQTPLRAMSEERAPTKDTLALHPGSAGAALAASMLDKATGLAPAHLRPLVLWAQGSNCSKKRP